MEKILSSIVKKNILELSQEEFHSEISLIEALIAPEIVSAYYYLALIPMTAWVVWEARCRDGKTKPSFCGRGGVVKYNTAFKEAVFTASIELGAPWLYSSWILRAIRYRGLDLYSTSTKWDRLSEALSRTMNYTLYLSLLDGAAKALYIAAERENEYAELTASYIYWDVTSPLYTHVANVLRGDYIADPILVEAEKLRSKIMDEYQSIIELLLADPEKRVIGAFREKTQALLRRAMQSSLEEVLKRVGMMRLHSTSGLEE